MASRGFMWLKGLANKLRSLYVKSPYSEFCRQKNGKGGKKRLLIVKSVNGIIK
jgi:hypothetical protein